MRDNMDSITIKPLGRRLLVKLEPVAEGKSQGGIYVPAKHSELTRTGKVLLLGDRCNEVFIDGKTIIRERIRVGDKVLVTFHAGIVVDSMSGETLYSAVDDTLRIINEEEILAIL